MNATLERDRVDQAWDRIETWLAGHAPRTLATLIPPAQPSEIRAAEESLGVTFPPGLVASLLRHNGVRGEDAHGDVDPAAFCLPSEHRLLPVAEILSVTGLLRSVQGDDSEPGQWWQPAYVQVAS